jgi:UDP-N-acetylglucosamine 4,6-dehydratase/5-epimerase
MHQQEIAKALDGQRILITGGTGSFGKEILQQLLQFSPAAVYVYSRDEKKQYDMQQEYAEYSRLHFMVGDIRDYPRVREAMEGIDVVFQAAALKQVPHCEDWPYEAVKTNIIGAENVRRAAIEAGVGSVVSISTDKAVKPVNVMGMTKAIQERIMLSQPNHRSRTRFVCVRYGNVLGSRGSVIPLFQKLILQNKPLTITNPDMTRFLLTLSQAVGLVLWATLRGEDGDLWVRKMPSARVSDLAEALALGLTGRSDYPQKIVGTRPGEKLHEVLVSEEEMWRAREFGEHFLIPAWFKLGEQAGPKEGSIAEYSSNSEMLLSVSEIHQLLEQDGWFDGNHVTPTVKLHVAA